MNQAARTTAPKMTTTTHSSPFAPSAFQEAIYEDVATGRGHLVVIARAGAGKTSTTIDRKSKAKTIEELLAWNAAHLTKEVKRLRAARRDTAVAEDTHDCILALCKDADTIGEIESSLKNLFADEAGLGVVTLGTTHKLKGLEAENVYMLARTPTGASAAGKEANCWYVAVTRAKNRLVMMRWGKPQEKGTPS